MLFIRDSMKRGMLMAVKPVEYTHDSSTPNFAKAGDFICSALKSSNVNMVYSSCLLMKSALYFFAKSITLGGVLGVFFTNPFVKTILPLV